MTNPVTKASIQMLAIDDGIALFDREYTHEGKAINAAICISVPVVRDRIEAVQWSKAEFGTENSDAVIAALASKIMRFGFIEKSDIVKNDEGVLKTGMPEMNPQLTLASDFIVDNFAYCDFYWMSLLMGKQSAASSKKK